MASVMWKIQRLKAMSVPEVIWRISQKRIQNKEKKTFSRIRHAVTECVFNNDLSSLVFHPERLGLNLDNSNYDLNMDIRLLAGAEYSDYKTKWNAGFQTENSWPDIFSYDLEYRQRDDIGDARTNWELNRHFQFALLAKDYAASGEKKYLDEFVELFNDWNVKNPFLWGISWTSVMEVAIRCSNWCYTLAFLSETDAPSDLLKSISNGILNMTDYITNHYSRYSSANNHLIIEMYVIGQSGILFDKPEWTDLAIRILTRELPIQNCSDGVNKEASLHYQAFYMEAMGLMTRLLRKNRIEVPEGWEPMLTQMSRFVADCMGEYGEVVAFGDDDEGKIVDLKGDWTEYYVYVLGLMSVLLDKSYIKNYTCETLYWLFAEIEIEEAKRSEPYISPQYCIYKEGGYSILRSVDRKVIIGIDHAPLGYGSIAAHGHADALSFQLFYEGKPIFVDPGTYIYHCDLKNRNEFRKTSNHNTVCIDGKDQSEMLGPFLWGKKANSSLLSCEQKNDTIEILLMHNGYSPALHKRRIRFDGHGEISIDDNVHNSQGQLSFLFPASCAIESNTCNELVVDQRFKMHFSGKINQMKVDYARLLSNAYGEKTDAICASLIFENEVKTEIHIV